ncbi:MAG: hypothetical protein WCK63_09805 [Betaproteobacteria bacterium]
MIAEFFRELRSQLSTFGQLIRTRDFWIYSAVILAFLLIAAAGIRLATGFDPLTRGQLQMNFSCHTGEGQLATIIIGLFIFAMACIFTLGEVINWVEATRQSRLPGRQQYQTSYWRPILHVLGTIVLGISGYSLMLSWCS